MEMNNQSTSESHSRPAADAITAAATLAPLTVLHIDDDPNDSELLRAAALKAKARFALRNAEDGDQAIAYLTGTGQYADRRLHPLPQLVLLDLKMPRATGFEILCWLKSQPNLRHIPVVVLSGSQLQEDMHQAYAIGANSYIVKPLGFEALVGFIRNIAAIWLPSPAL
jgi:CheY-like chemotaxis protein